MDNPNSSSYTVTDLDPGQTYNFTAVVFSDEEWSEAAYAVATLGTVLMLAAAF